MPVPGRSLPRSRVNNHGLAKYAPSKRRSTSFSFQPGTKQSNGQIGAGEQGVRYVFALLSAVRTGRALPLYIN